VTDVKADKLRGNVWWIESGYMKATKDVVAYGHPAIFPDALAHDHILSWSNTGDLVIDPFTGSGTTCKAAKELGRNFLGFEINPEYCKIAERRISQGVLDFAS
jgi:site-specific DNA-methyltransferase (adenine-specific)